ncbi:MAG: hypothetical protein RQ761_12015 [Bacteroidales bacterium]|nr:hypothetical protein [Bacteroidales bacterium]
MLAIAGSTSTIDISLESYIDCQTTTSTKYKPLTEKLNYKSNPIDIYNLDFSENEKKLTQLIDFTNKIIENTITGDGEFNEVMNRNFWDLI